MSIPQQYRHIRQTLGECDPSLERLFSARYPLEGGQAR
jgi:hypothetical protein